MSIEYTPSDNKANFEPDYDVFVALHEAQRHAETLDDFDKLTWPHYEATEITKRLLEKPIRVSLELTSFHVEVEGHQHRYSYNKPDAAPVTIQGYIGQVGFGRIQDYEGFFACLYMSNFTFHDSLTDEELAVEVIIPFSKIVEHTYLPESYDLSAYDEPTQPMPPVNLDDPAE